MARIDQILSSAASVFARSGVARATTNAIAAEAGISPGSLYQFFRGKDEIARSLGERYAADIAELHRRSMADLNPQTPLPEVLDRIIDPIVAFKNDHPAYVALFARGDLPDALRAPMQAVEASFAERVGDVVARRNPRVDHSEALASARVMIALFTGVVGSLGGITGDADRDLREVKTALLGYLHGKQWR